MGLRSRPPGGSRRRPRTAPAPPTEKGRGSCLFDQLTGGSELGLPSIELAIKFPATKLGEDLPHPRRLTKAERCHIRACDREPDPGETPEVVVEPRQVGESK